MNYRLVKTSASDEYGKYRTEFDAPGASEAYAWLEKNDPRYTSTVTAPDGRRIRINRNAPLWERVADAMATLRPAHCDATGQWVYVDGQYRPYAHGETLMALYAEVIAHIAGAVPTPYLCAAAPEGCVARVAHRGEYCPSCQRDAD
jgi:hypothetical protein